MRPGWQLSLALTASAVLHAAVIGGPGWAMPDDFDGGAQQALSATLRPPLPEARPPAPARPVRRGGERRRPAPVAPVAQVAAEPTAGEPMTDEAPTDDSPVVAAPVEEPVVMASAAEAPTPARSETTGPAAVATVRVPARFRLQYRISLGSSGFVIGRAIEEFSRDGHRYEFRSVMETTGIARLFKTIRMVYLSEGEVVAGGLRPHSFSIERDGKITERASFDWSAGTVRLEPSERSFPLQAGAQDLLSMFCQLALQPAGGGEMVIPVVTRKRVEPYRFVTLGEQEVEIGQGRMSAVHLRYKDPDGPSTTDVWLAPEVGRLPVRIRLVDTKGDAYVQTAEVVEYDEGERL